MRTFNHEFSPGTRVYWNQTNQFKTVVSSAVMRFQYRPGMEEVYALLAYLLSSATEQHPTSRDFSAHRERCYGAKVHVIPRRLGQYQTFTFQVEVIDGAFLGKADELICIMFDLLSEIMYQPLLNSKGTLFEEHFFREKRAAYAQILQSYENEKENYAALHLRDYLPVGHPLSNLGVGTPEGVLRVTNRQAWSAYRELLDVPYDIFVVGNVRAQQLLTIIPSQFHFVNHSFETSVNDPLPEIPFQEIIEPHAFTQSHLLMVYRFPVLRGSQQQAAAMTFSFLFGGGPRSLLFRELREERGLCYAVASDYFPTNGAIIVNASIDSTNYHETLKAIADQIQVIQKGDFSEEDLRAIKKMMMDSLQRSFDRPGMQLGVLISQVLDTAYVPPHELQHMVHHVDRKSIAECAQQLQLQMTYFIKQGGANHEPESSTK